MVHIQDFITFTVFPSEGDASRRLAPLSLYIPFQQIFQMLHASLIIFHRLPPKWTLVRLRPNAFDSVKQNLSQEPKLRGVFHEPSVAPPIFRARRNRLRRKRRSECFCRVAELTESPDQLPISKPVFQSR